MQKAVVGLVLFISILAGCATHSGEPSAAVQPVRETHGYMVEKAVIYTPPAWPQPLPADIYRPEGAGPFPGVLMVHGGGWHEGKRKHMGRFSKTLARRGYVVVNIDYRLAPQSHFPAQIEDLREAVRWMRTNAASLKLDPTRIGAWGYSAGAELVALLGNNNEGPDARVSAVVAGGLPADFSQYPDSPLIRDFIGATPAQNPQAWAQASPVRWVSADNAPMFIYHGTWDTTVVVDNATAMKTALDAAGVPAELYLVHGVGHVAMFLLGFGANGAAVDFLDRSLK